jgi:hypothetical protein
MNQSELTRKLAPEIWFSKDEQYFPCSIFFAGSSIVRNKAAYDALSSRERKRLISCYYHVVEDEKYTAYQYWYYYVYNDYSGGWTAGLPDRHNHDMEFAIVFVSKSSGRPAAMALNQHHWLNWILDPSLETPVLAEEGGHGMFRNRRAFDKWQGGGLQTKVEPTEPVEQLRQRFLNPEPVHLIEDDGTIRGESANFIGMWAKPRVPWARFREYALPISRLLSEALEDAHRLLLRKPAEAYMYELPKVLEHYVPSRELGFSFPYDKPTRRENLDEALRLGLITREDYDALA